MDDHPSSALKSPELASIREGADERQSCGAVDPAAGLPQKAVGFGWVSDYDVHGIVGVRVCWIRKNDAAVVDRLLGPLRKPLSREPDIMIRFVQELSTGALKVVERDRSVFDNENFFLLTDGKKVRIPFDQIGSKLQIVCETGAQSVPLLTELIQLTALAKGFVPVHASAFVHAGSGVVVTGWTKGGKTESLLAFAGRGTAYIGDEWVLVSGDGRQAFGLPAPVVVWSWHARQIPSLAAHVSRMRRAVWRIVGVLETFQRWSGSRSLRRIMPMLRRHYLRFDIAPKQIVGPSATPLRGGFGKLVLAVTHDCNNIEVKPADAQVVAARMSASVQREFAPLMDGYFAFQFAFPERRNRMLDGLAEQHTRMLRDALHGKEAWTVLHPYPTDLGKLFDALLPFVLQPSTIHLQQAKNIKV